MDGEKKKPLLYRFLVESAKGKQVGIIPIFFSLVYHN